MADVEPDAWLGPEVVGAEAKDELTLGGWGSGVRVVNKVSHSAGLTLR